MSKLLQPVLLVSLLIVALASFIFVRAHAGDGDALVTRQQHAQVLSPASVSAVVKAAPDPGTGTGHGVAAVCRPLGNGPLKNPWSCAIGYPSGRDVRWKVTLASDGSYEGIDEVVRYQGRTVHGPGSINGCCVAVP